MARCYQCHTELGGAKFCPECGLALTCRGCGHAIRSAAESEDHARCGQPFSAKLGGANRQQHTKKMPTRPAAGGQKLPVPALIGAILGALLLIWFGSGLLGLLDPYHAFLGRWSGRQTTTASLFVFQLEIRSNHTADMTVEYFGGEGGHEEKTETITWEPGRDGSHTIYLKEQNGQKLPCILSEDGKTMYFGEATLTRSR